MIEIVSIRTIRPAECDEAWAIVRSMKNPIAGVKQVADLSPSTSLFYRYLDMKKRGEWNEAAFRNIYVPTFIAELKANGAAKALLNQLYRLDKDGKRIQLACFCADEAQCHRSIVAGLLQGAGCDVKAARDYSEYWSMWQAR